ncbi:hypothetical protein G7046_g3932 [Stylonectria norvegica]|nr:hypothetical protein G7046_g3932 [Stylonectria norvegica]
MPYLNVQEGRSVYYSYTAGSAAVQSRPVLVFIHGLGSSSSFFAPIIPFLFTAGFSCLALDSYGSGLTKYTGVDRGIEGIAQDVISTLSELRIPMNCVVLIGHSMGCIVASHLASQHQVQGVVLLGPVNPSAALADIFSARIKIVEEKGMDAMADIIPFTATGPISTSVHDAFIRALLLSQSKEGYNANCRAIANAKVPAYSDVKCSLLILAGSHDKTSPRESAERILRSWGSKDDAKSIETLEKVGHWHCIEASQAVEEAILKFLGRIGEV